VRAVPPGNSLLAIADCAHWIRTFFDEQLTTIEPKNLLLDRHHLQGRCAHEASRACRGRAAKHRFLRRLRRHLWRGDVPAAVRVIEREHPQARAGSTLRTFAEYLLARQCYIPSYRDRRRACRYIGSGQSEKANDLLVARRQKERGMHWSAQMCDALAALQTVRLNQEWDHYRLLKQGAAHCCAAAQPAGFANQRCPSREASLPDRRAILPEKRR
jgi:hypothetical protein